jgi:N utilization substance protein B
MATRRDAREWAMKLLFEFDLNPPKELQVALDAFWVENPAGGKPRAFAERLVRGVLDNLDSLDETLSGCAQNWDVTRMGTVERNVMRVALYELLHCDDIPPAVTINEAVDITKYFSTTESGRFVNGILDRARKMLKNPENKTSN